MGWLFDTLEWLASAVCSVPLLALGGLLLALRYLFSRRHDEHASRQRRIQRRLAQVHTQRCLGCGYDVRASDFRCPECGRVIVSEAAVLGWIPPDAQTAAAALERVQNDEDGPVDVPPATPAASPNPRP